MRQHFKLKIVATQDVMCVENLAAAEEEFAVGDPPAVHHVTLVINGQPSHLLSWHRCVVSSSILLDFNCFVISYRSGDL